MNSFKELHELNKAHKLILDKRGGVKYHDHLVAFEKENPGVNAGRWQAALKFGKDNADSFMKAALDHTHKDHEKTLPVYQAKFGGNKKDVEEHFTKEAIDMTGAIQPEIKNLGYENRMLKGYKLDTQQDGAFYNKFKDFIKTKWDAVGYKNDEEYIDSFWNLHPLSLPNGLPHEVQNAIRFGRLENPYIS